MVVKANPPKEVKQKKNKKKTKKTKQLNYKKGAAFSLGEKL